ncbi:MAG TPA: protoheme IX farnesyltransferase [Geobacteraceae bacterium]|nr:protoheme IX farnesyltransferase [Geobacteraceae bacterium]
MTSILLLCRPGVLALVALAGLSGMVLAAGGLPDAATAVCTLFSLFLSASGSVMLNSVLDYPQDLKMARLRGRVEAVAVLGRNRAALLAGGLIILSVIISSGYLNTLATILIMTAALAYVGPYTLWLKRRSPFGAVPGGVPGALPVLIGYAAVAGFISPAALVLFAVVLLWQPAHFWIFALRHREDYLASGVPVLPAARGESRTKWFIFLYASALMPASLVLGVSAGFSTWYQGIAVVLGVLFVVSCYFHVIRRPLFDKAFRASIWYLFLLFCAVIAEACITRLPATG